MPDLKRAIIALALLSVLLLGGAPAQQAPPAPTHRTSFAFAAFGDWGVPERIRPQQLAVRDGLRKFVAAHPIGCVVLLGDNFYPDGVSSVDDPQWRAKFETVYRGPGLDVPYFATLGNHDHDGDVEAQRAYAKKSPRWRLEEMPCVHSHGGRREAPLVDFFMIDTCRWKHSRRERLDRVGKLRRLLRESRALWKIVCGHHPVYTNSDKKDDNVLLTSLRPLLRKHGVDMYLCGDQHNMQALAARQDRDRERTLYLIAGSGGARLDEMRREDDSLFQRAAHGFLHVELDAETGRVRYVGTSGETLFDASVRRGEGVRGVRVVRK